jgi:hypothetical protein
MSQFTQQWYDEHLRKRAAANRGKKPSGDAAPAKRRGADSPVVELHPGPSPHEATPSEARHPGRYLVCITSFRSRLLDEDNACEKYAVDALRYAGVIPEDSPGIAKIVWRQEQVPKAEEITVIEIFPPCTPTLKVESPADKPDSSESTPPAGLPCRCSITTPPAEPPPGASSGITASPCSRVAV